MKVLLAYDGFSHSDNALATAAELGGSPTTEITILSVVPPDARGSSPVVTSAYARIPPRTSPRRTRTASGGSSRRCGWSTASR